ncbi:hypothetical protein ACH5RR_033775 [Cinchona calisaya]|uniref:Uncharacterized protein n=1 Tax=Cinchona calisaya TaxID=153742 RepID=A0ABD2YCR3_9GENT
MKRRTSIIYNEYSTSTDRPSTAPSLSLSPPLLSLQEFEIGLVLSVPLRSLCSLCEASLHRVQDRKECIAEIPKIEKKEYAQFIRFYNCRAKRSLVKEGPRRMKEEKEQFWSRRSFILPEFVDCSVRIYNGKTSARCKITEGKIQVGLVRATAKVTEWKTTGRHPGLEHVVKEAHWAGVLQPCLRGTVECRYHEREVQDTRRRNPGNYSPMCQSLMHPGPGPSSAGEA